MPSPSPDHAPDIPVSNTPEQQRADLQTRIEATQSIDTPILADIGAEVFQTWEAWKTKPENKGKGFREFVQERNSTPENDAQRFVEDLLKGKDFGMQDVVIVEENKVRIENRGQQGDAEVIIKENGDYSVTIAGETKLFLAHQEKELIDFLKGEIQ